MMFFKMAENKCTTKILVVGDKLSRISYLEVIRKTALSVTVRNQEGLEWDITSSIVENECYSASQHESDVVEVTKTEMAQIFSELGDSVFTVNFNKQPKVEDVFDTIANTGKLISNAEMKKRLVEGMKGEERTLVGYKTNTENDLGRSNVVDLELPITEKNRLRQVDHRSINWLITKNVKFKVVKSKKKSS